MDFGWFGASRRKREQQNGIQALESRVRELELQLNERQEFDQELYRQFGRNRRVDLVDFGAIRVFMYVDDLSYQQVAARWRNHKPDAGRRTNPYEALTPGQCWEKAHSGLLALLLSHYAMERLDFAFLDIGCQYGTSAISACRIIQSLALAVKVHAFDCGVAADLTPHNLKLNHVEGDIVFNRLAVCDASHPVIVFAELNHSENNRVVNRAPQDELLSYVVDGTSIDDYLRLAGENRHIIAKIDTQGGEVEVLKGMEETLRGRCCTLIAEFVPHAVVTRVDPATWLAGVCQEFHVLDVGEQDFYHGPARPLARIGPDGVEAFVQQVDVKPSRYADLLLVPKKLPNAARLLDRVAQAPVNLKASAP